MSHAARPALLLVDVQRDFLARAGLFPPAGEVIEKVALILAAFRRLGLPVIHARTVVRPDGSDCMPHWRRGGTLPCVDGTEGARPPAALAAIEGEAVVNKTGYSAFGNPDLAPLLERLTVDTLVVAGLYEHGCVRAAVLDAYARGLRVWVAGDAVASDDPLHAEVTRTWLGARAATYLHHREILARLGAGPVAPSSSDGRMIAEVPVEGAAEVGAAVRAGASARPAWARRDASDRATRLDAWADELEARERDLAHLMADEIGKPVTDGRAEVRWAAALVRSAARRAVAVEAPWILADGVRARRNPVGTVALVTPYNNPVGIPAGKIAPALSFGNAVVWKPAEEAPATSMAVRDSILRSGVDPGLVSLVAGDAMTAREVMTAKGVAAVSFTGSSRTGRRVAAVCLEAGKPLQAELGGNNAAIVMASSAWRVVAPDLARAAFGFAGQRCTALRRFLVERSIADGFGRALALAAGSLCVGDPREPETEVGPLISPEHRARVAAVVAEACGSGAEVLAGGGVPAGMPADGAWFAPTVLRMRDPSTVGFQEETFGPVAVILAVDGFDEALDLANATPYGLVAALYSEDREQQARFLEKAEAGILRVNRRTADVHPDAPFGGFKGSGLGPPEHGIWDADFYTRPQALYSDEATAEK